MDMRPEPFEPPAPIPRTIPPSRLEIIRVMFRNPLELWGQAKGIALRDRDLLVAQPPALRSKQPSGIASRRDGQGLAVLGSAERSEVVALTELEDGCARCGAEPVNFEN